MADVKEKRRAKKERKKVRERDAYKSIQRFEFAELNIRHTGSEQATLNLVHRAILLGYDSVVINIDVGDLVGTTAQSEAADAQPPPSKKKRKAMNKELKAQLIPDPYLVDEAKLDLSSIEAAGKKFRQFSRLTVTLTDSTSVHKLNYHPKRPLYDIIAVRCLDEAMLTTMSRKGDLIDVITMDAKAANGRYAWMHKQKLIWTCIQEGVTFELCYGDALYDNETRRQMFINGRALSTATKKGRGIVLCSGAEKFAAMRGPYDVANMCTLFGWQSKEGKRFVSKNACQLLLRAQSRRTIKGAIHIADVENAPAPANVDSAAHLAALADIPEFKAQMEAKPTVERKVQILETS